MSIRKLNENMNIISMLDDEPNDEGGLTSSELKAKFDEGAVTIKGYINDTLIPDVDASISEAVNAATISAGNMPRGGMTGQALLKRSNADFDTEFADLPEIPDPLEIVTTQKLITAAGSSMGLASSMSVENLLSNVAKSTIRAGSCTTAAATVAKVATLAGFTRATGSIVEVTFTNTNTAAAPTLNVNSTGAATIQYAGAALTSGAGISTAIMIYAGIPHLFMFDGTYWQLLNPYTKAGQTSSTYGQYTGTGTFNTVKTINVGMRANLIIIVGNDAGKSICVLVRTEEGATLGYGMAAMPFVSGNATIQTLSANMGFSGGAFLALQATTSAAAQMNVSGVVYTWYAVS